MTQIHRPKPHDAPEMLADLMDAGSTIARQFGLDDEQADELALRIVEQLENDWRGQQLYFGSTTKMRLSKRDLDIFREFTGNNVPELAAKYKVSAVWIYAVLRRVREQTSTDAQQALL